MPIAMYQGSLYIGSKEKKACNLVPIKIKPRLKIVTKSGRTKACAAQVIY